ncbi:MAG: tetratricopeptide repeat protein [Pseudomonadota bacterium]
MRAAAFLALAAASLAAGCQQHGASSSAAPTAAAPADPLQIGVRLLASNQADMALRAFNQEMAENGPSAEALTGAAIANMRVGRGPLATKLLRKALRLDPFYAPAHNNLGVALYDEGDYLGALTAFQKAHELTGGSDPAVAVNLDMAAFVVADTAKTTPQLDESEFEVILYGNGLYRLERKTGPVGADAAKAEGETS